MLLSSAPCVMLMRVLYLQNSSLPADMAFCARYAALRFSLIRPLRTCMRSIRPVISTVWSRWRRGRSCRNPWCGRCRYSAVLGQHVSQVPLAENQHVVRAFTAKCVHEQ